MKTSLSKLALAVGLGMLALPDSASARSNFDNCIKWQDGRLVLIRGSRVQPIDQPMTLANGTVVTPDGYFIKRGRHRTPLFEGETIAMDGIVMYINTLPGRRGRG